MPYPDCWPAFYSDSQCSVNECILRNSRSRTFRKREVAIECSNSREVLVLMHTCSITPSIIACSAQLFLMLCKHTPTRFRAHYGSVIYGTDWLFCCRVNRAYIMARIGYFGVVYTSRFGYLWHGLVILVSCKQGIHHGWVIYGIFWCRVNRVYRYIM